MNGFDGFVSAYRTDLELGSGIVSTALQCGTGRCPTESLELNTPVRITIRHSEEVKVCVLLKLMAEIPFFKAFILILSFRVILAIHNNNYRSVCSKTILQRCSVCF